MLIGNMEVLTESEPDQSTRPRVETFGPDRVEIHDRRVVIHSPIDMDRWDVVEHRKPLIRFDNRTWTLANKNLVEGEWVRYELVPWEPADLERHGHELDYGAEFVEAREQARRRDRWLTLETTLLRIFSPLAGFLFARTKSRLEDRLGITAVAMTSKSLLLQYLAIVCALTYTVVGVFSSGFSGISTGVFTRALDGVLVIATLALVLLLDAIVRWGRLVDEEREPPGFYEWLWRSQRRE